MAPPPWPRRPPPSFSCNTPLRMPPARCCSLLLSPSCCPLIIASLPLCRRPARPFSRAAAAPRRPPCPAAAPPNDPVTRCLLQFLRELRGAEQFGGRRAAQARAVGGGPLRRPPPYMLRPQSPALQSSRTQDRPKRAPATATSLPHAHPKPPSAAGPLARPPHRHRAAAGASGPGDAPGGRGELGAVAHTPPRPGQRARVPLRPPTTPPQAGGARPARLRLPPTQAPLHRLPPLSRRPPTAAPASSLPLAHHSVPAAPPARPEHAPSSSPAAAAACEQQQRRQPWTPTRRCRACRPTSSSS